MKFQKTFHKTVIENDFPQNIEIPPNLLNSLQTFQSIIDTETGPISRNFVAKWRCLAIVSFQCRRTGLMCWKYTYFVHR